MTPAACNRRRGETVAIIGGEPVTLRLTLGALAELESAFDVNDLAGLAARFARGALSSRDLLAIVTVAMRGGGRRISDAEAAALPIAGELPGLAAAVADLLALTFGEQGHQAADAASGEAGASRPFLKKVKWWIRILQRLLQWGRSLFPGTT